LFAIVVIYGCLFAYGLLIVGQVVLFGVVPPLLFGGGYFLWRFLSAVEAIAEAQQRLSRQREE
jgi:hypothetical protein